MPDHAQRVVNQLAHLRIPKHHFHTIARGVELETLPEASNRLIKDTALRVENLLRKLNLAVFALAMLGLFIALANADVMWSVTAAAIMLLTFITGEQFVVKIPDVHLSEFTDALAH